MSQTKNECIVHSKIVREYLSGRTPLRYDDNTMVTSMSDISTIHDAYLLWYLATCDTLSFFEESPFNFGWRRWINSITSAPLVELAKALKTAGNLLVTEDYSSYETFKQSLSVFFPFIGEIISPMRKVLDRWWRESDTDALAYLYSWFLFISHVHLSELDVLKEQALRDYLLIEESLPDSGFTESERDILEKWFPRTASTMHFFAEDYMPSHGNGSTADSGKSAIRKYLGLFKDPRLHMLCNRLDVDPYPRAPAWRDDDACRTSKTVFVAKSLTKHRTISMEPATLMWHQKAVRRALLRFMRKGYLRRRYTPEAQEPNRDLAWEGSIDGSFATIDLTSASDSVSWALVRKWFSKTVIFPWMLWTRSTHSLLPDGRVIPLKKYAPMGSDLCFPIECIVFAAITECAIREVGSDPIASRYRIYGDDIVVEDEFAEAVMARLEKNGFCVNRDKSFSGSQARGFFRESCGGFFFNGVDITPLRISRKFRGLNPWSDRNGRRVIDPEQMVRLISFANEAQPHFPLVRHYLINVLLDVPQRWRPIFSSDGLVGLFSTQPTNFHLMIEDAHRYCAHYTVHGGIHVQYDAWRDEWEDIRLFEYLKATRSRRSLTWPEDRVDVNLRSVKCTSWTTRRRITYL